MYRREVYSRSTDVRLPRDSRLCVPMPLLSRSRTDDIDATRRQVTARRRRQDPSSDLHPFPDSSNVCQPCAQAFINNMQDISRRGNHVLNTPKPPTIYNIAYQDPSIRLHENSGQIGYGAHISQATFNKHIPQFSSRVNPIKPTTPYKRYVGLETIEAHCKNAERAQNMQSSQQKVFHDTWKKPVYGNAWEREEYGLHLRRALKQQIMDSDFRKRLALVKRVQETDRALKEDLDFRTNELEERRRKKERSMSFRDANKLMMEDRWAQLKLQKAEEITLERLLLQHNPINWSCTLT